VKRKKYKSGAGQEQKVPPVSRLLVVQERTFIMRDRTQKLVQKFFSRTIDATLDWLDWAKCHVEAAIDSGSPTNATAGAFL
jgi:hypothetical protein